MLVPTSFPLLLLSSCQTKSTLNSEPAVTEQISGPSIGSATLEKNGELFVMLRAEDESKGQTIIGDAAFTYTKKDPQYQRIIDHVGGLKRGESKSVPPWPDAPSNLQSKN